MQVTFIGSGDAFGSGGRFNTCIMVESASSRVLVDCGASSLVALRRQQIDPNGIDGIAISHLHGDHFGGLPFFLLDAQLVSRRRKPLRLIGPLGFRERLLAAREIFFPRSSTVAPGYALEIEEIAPGGQSAIGDIAIAAFEVDHFCAAPPLALRLEMDGKRLCYTGDTEWTDRLIEAARDVDLLIAEAYFFDKKIKWHLDYATLRDNLDRIAARRVVLTHMSPDMLARQSEVSGCELASDGLRLSI
ncbi:MAG: MBL fold metallo-hydrolase [Reyranellaceae bacterium]